MKKIEITCKTSLNIPITDIAEFQGNLKELSKDSFERLKASLLKYGYTFPCFVWKHSGTGGWVTIDAHQRNRVCRMLIEDGYEIGKGNEVPCVEIMAKDEKEAKEKILLAASQYARITSEGLFEFLHDAGLELDMVEPVLDLPNIDFKDFREEFFEGGGGAGCEGKENKKGLVICPKCGHKF